MGWTVTELVGAVSKRTEHRADTKIDLLMEFFLGLDEFAIEKHYWWRKKRFNFTTQVGVGSYDISTEALGNVQDLGQLDELILLNADGITKALDLTPIIDPIAQLQAIQNNVPSPPSGYFLDINASLSTLRLQAPASVAQIIMGTHWAVPQISDTSVDIIPLVPGYLHWGLVYMLERRVYEFLYGQDDPRFEVSNARYNEFVTKADKMPEWTAKKSRSASVDGRSMRITRAVGGR